MKHGIFCAFERIGWILALVLGANLGVAAAPSHPSFVQVEDDPSLPRVLLIGDSISMGYTLPVRELLEGEANVHRPARNCRSTKQTLAEIEDYLGEGDWDVIHFNWGIHDFTYMGEDGRATTPDKGQHQVPIEQYETNLRKLVKRLKKTGAELVWCATTPIPEGATYRQKGDEVQYNAVAERVMNEHGIPINDLYGYALPQLEEIQRPGGNVHFTDSGSKVLAKKVAESIREALARRAGSEPAEACGNRASEGAEENQ